MGQKEWASDMVADAPMIVSGVFGCHLTSLYVWNVLELAVWAESSSNVGEHQDAVTDCAFHRNGLLPCDHVDLTP